MARDKFDKELSKRMSSQEMQPDAAVWGRIEASLNTAVSSSVVSRRNKKILTLTAITSVAAALLLSFILLTNNEKPETQIVTVPLVEKQMETQMENEIISQTSSTIENEPLMAVATEKISIKAKKRIGDNAVPKTIQDTILTEGEPVVKKSSSTKKSRSVMTSQSPVQNQRGAVMANKMETKNRKNRLAISVSGSGNFSSSSSVVGNNGIVRPMKTINENGVISLYSSKNDRRNWKHNMPLAFSVTVQKMITKKIGIETGLTYTYLSSTSKGENILDQDIKQQLNYLGIPLSVVYSIFGNKQFEFYVKGGFLVDAAIASKGTSKLDGESQSIDINTKGVQFSAMLQLGASYNLTNYMSLYLEPTGNYYFNSNQPISYRTENDFGFTAMLGLRFRIIGAREKI